MPVNEPILRSGRRSDRWIILSVAALAAWLYFGTAIEPGDRLFSKYPSGYYGLQTQGFRQGHLYVSSPPHPGLLALKDPYDPVANAPYRVHDMTLYRGHYYLYFGVVPVLLVFWPVLALTGSFPTEPAVVAAFCTGAAWLALALLWAVRRRYFPRAATGILLCAALCLVFANPMSRLVEQPAFYQVAISSAILLQMAMIAALYRGLTALRHPWVWLALASALFGLAVGSRPSYLPSGVALMAAAVVVGLRGQRGRKISVLVQALLATGGPAAFIGAGLLGYNWLRFQSPFEFGMRYQLAGETFLGLRPIAWKYLGPHLGDYLFHPGFWSNYFPFFSGPSSQPYGFLRYIPWGWLAPLAFLPRTEGETRAAGRGPFPTVVALASVGNLLLLASFFGLTDRYPGDYTCTWLLLSGIGALRLSQRAVSGRGRKLVHGLCAGIAAIALFNGAAAFLARAPVQFPLVAMGRVANWPLYAWRHAHREAEGALKIDVELSGRPNGQSEPIFETGRASDERDWLQLDYLPGNRARLAFFHAGMNGLIGDSFPIPADRKLSIETRCSSLLPPFSYPAFSGWTREEFEATARDLKVTVNGMECLRAILTCYDSSPADLTVGRFAWIGGGVADGFSGRVLAVQRLPMERTTPSPSMVARGHPVELLVRLPAQHEAGADPILVTGQGAASDLLSCYYDGRGGIRFALDHYGFGGPRSDVIAYDPTRLHRLTVWLGSLEDGAHAPSRAGSSGVAVPWSHRLLVLWDDRTLLNVEQMFYDGTAAALIGVNPYGSTTAGRHFPGRIERVRSVGFEGLPPRLFVGEYGRVQLDLKFPLYLMGLQEPLVVTGVSGAGDFVYVCYLDPRHVSVGFDHWGVGGFTGPPMEIDYGRPHRLAITLGSLYPPGSDLGRKTLVRVTIDGRTALEGQSPTHPSEAGQIRIGANPIGGSTCGPAFTGRILSVTRAAEPRS